MSSLTEERSCPMCGAEPASGIAEVRARTPAETLSDNDLTKYFVGFRDDQCFFTYHRCRACQLLWNPIYFTEEALTEIYSRMPDNTSVSGERDSARTQAGYADLIGIRASQITRYLELGADIGLLAREVASRANVGVAVAVEPNLAVHNELIENLGSNGQIYARLSEVPPGELFTDIAAIHVMDHLLNPKEALTELREKVSPGGRILIVVHDESSALRRILRERWAPFCLQHPQLFNRSTLQSMLISTGLRTLREKKTTNWLSIRQAAALGSSVGLIPEAVTSYLPTLAVPLRLGNISNISARTE